MSLALVLVGVALLSFAGSEGWRRWALRRGVIDVPGQRSSHESPTPRGAGLGLVLALLVGMAMLLPASAERHAAMLSIAAVAALGLFDDLRSLPPMLKLAGQVVAALPLGLALPVPLAGLDLLQSDPLASAAGSLLASGLAVLLVNAWNFMDGINGIATLAACAVGLAVSLAEGPSPTMALVLIAACLGFLPLNFPRARVFMGDCGSHGLGMAVAVLMLWPSSAAASLTALAAASPFIVDVLGTLLRRAGDGEPLTRPHRRHLYQLAVRNGYSHARVAVAYMAWMAASGASVAAMGSGGGQGGGAVTLVLTLNAAAWWFASHRFERRLRKEGRW